jgi:hypothetical protein
MINFWNSWILVRFFNIIINSSAITERFSIVKSRMNIFEFKTAVFSYSKFKIIGLDTVFAIIFQTSKSPLECFRSISIYL